MSAQAGGGPAPRVSVIMATFNGAPFILDSVRSVLSQTWIDFELVIVDDGSTDGTQEILAGISDPRIRVIRNATNLGVVELRNRCFAAARGEYVAMLDHDDLSRPTRLAKQVAYLDAHPGTVLVGTDGHVLDRGRLAPDGILRRTSPAVIHWQMLLVNPLICSSVMFRAESVRRLGAFVRDSYEYADDFDLYHRLRSQGDIARLDESLTIYRLHTGNAFRAHEPVMAVNAARVLLPAYARVFGPDAQAAATLIVNHVALGAPVPDASSLAAVARCLERVTESFLANEDASASDRAMIEANAGAMRRRVLRVAARGGHVGLADLRRLGLRGVAPSIGDYARLSINRLPVPKPVHEAARRILRPSGQRVPRLRPSRLQGRACEPLPVDPDRPPTLYVVVDTEAEFDWSGPFAREHNSVAAIDAIGRGQAIFDAHGLRPIYVVDYPIASQPHSIKALRNILDRGGCEIGVHLHPWTTPPFDEDVSARNSFAGNLPPALEERKLATLVAKIRESFGVSPAFYRAGRHGIGAETTDMLGRLGIKVDLSVLPGADLRPRFGPDFRGLRATPYRVAGGNIITVPMSRAHVGLAAPLGGVMETVLQRPALTPLRLRSVLSRLGILDTITLTPEGVTIAEQKRLVRAMLRRGDRLFVLHYHSPSLAPGFTPYVRTQAEAEDFVARLGEILRFFFEEIGGMPGYPRDLLPS